MLKVLNLHAGNMMGGIEHTALRMAECKHLCPELCQSFALTFDSTFASELRRRYAETHILSHVRLRNPFSVARCRRSLHQLLAKQSFDVVVSHAPWTQVLLADFVRDRHLPLVFWMHGNFEGHWLERLASLQRPDFVICNSHFTRSTLSRFYPSIPHCVIYNPVLHSRGARSRSQTRSALGIAPEEVVILHASRMEAWKGHRSLLRAISLIQTQVPWRVLIVGTPNTTEESAYFASLQRLAAHSEASARIHFISYRTDVPELMTACDIHCQPNEKPEPFGNVFVEALLSQLAVVTYKIGGAAEIIDRATGVLVEPGNIEALAAALTRLIEDGALRKRLGQEGPARANRLCDPEKQIRRLGEVLASVSSRGS